MTILGFLVGFVVCRLSVSLANSVSGNGVNLQPSYYNNGNTTFGWSLMKSYSAVKMVRIEIEPTKVEQAVNWISQARSHGYSIIATYHDYTKLGSDNPDDLLTAANWWVANLNHLTKGNLKDFTINMMNEWGSHDMTSDLYASSFNKAVSKVREVYSSWIVADIPGWGQEIQIAQQSSSLISDSKIIFSAHIYPGSWNSAMGRVVQPSDMDTLASTGRPCIIGEFGVGSSGDTDVAGVVQRARSLGWSVFAWSWNGDGGQMNMVSPQWTQEPTAAQYTPNQPYFDQVYNMLV